MVTELLERLSRYIAIDGGVPLIGLYGRIPLSFKLYPTAESAKADLREYIDKQIAHLDGEWQYECKTRHRFIRGAMRDMRRCLG